MLIYQHLDEAIISLSSDCTIEDINQAALSLYEWKKSDVIGQVFDDLLEHEDVPSPLPNDLSSIPVGKFLKNIETAFEKKARKVIVWKITAHKKRDGFILLGKDITKLRQAEEKIFELDSIIAQTPGNLYWFSKDLIYLGCNENSAKTLGMKRSDTVGHDFRSLMKRVISTNDEIVEVFVNHGLEVIRTGKPLLDIEEPPFYGHNNKLQYYLANKVPLRNKKGEVYGVIGISTDITDRKKTLMETLRNQKEKAQAASQAKSEFIANMSHDIRTPITGMLGMLQDLLDTAESIDTVLHDSDPTSHTQENLFHLLSDVMSTLQTDSDVLMESTNELLQLCNEILEIVRLESGRVLETPKSFHIRELIQHNITLLKPVAQHQNLSLLVNIAEDIPQYLKGQRTYLDRTLLNLISNALKFTKKGFVKVTVSLINKPNTLYKKGDSVMLQCQIEDSGIGIPKDKFDMIFEHFSRLTSSYQGIYKGFGLGLYTVKCYVKAMGGTISVSSEIEKGSCFTLTVPFIVSDDEDRQNQSMPMMKRPLSPADSLKTRLEKQPAQKTTNAHVLVVEDSRIAAMAVKIMLTKLDCSVEIAENGEQALKKAKSSSYDLIFMTRVLSFN